MWRLWDQNIRSAIKLSYLKSHLNANKHDIEGSAWRAVQITNPEAGSPPQRSSGGGLTNIG
jgi:hypothetical protein